MLDLRGKRGLIMGVANERSIAWGIAKAMSDAGASLHLHIKVKLLVSGYILWLSPLELI